MRGAQGAGLRIYNADTLIKECLATPYLGVGILAHLRACNNTILFKSCGLECLDNWWSALLATRNDERCLSEAIGGVKSLATEAKWRKRCRGALHRFPVERLNFLYGCCQND